MAGTLYVVGTPIGNLEDMTFRAVRILGEVALVAAEDTRAAARLFARFGLRTPAVSCFEGNEAARAEEIVERLRRGEDVAYVSEAGMPGVSDPGRRVVGAALAAGCRVEVIPGPSAAVTALVASGLPSDEFHFVGFLPRKESEREALLGRLRGERATLLFYEAPGRTARTFADLAAAFGGERRAALCRELTKLHEEVRRGTLAALAEETGHAEVRGEVTIVVEGAGEEGAAAAKADAEDVEELVRRAVAEGKDARTIAAELALRTGRPRRALYQLAIALRGRAGSGR